MKELQTLQTQRMRLEPLEDGHARALFQGLHDEAAYDFLHDRFPGSEAPLRAPRQRPERRASRGDRQAWLLWALCLRSTKRYIGYVQATLHGNGHASIAYCLFERAWGHGYVREVAGALIHYLREDWGTTRVLADIDTSSLRSIRLLQALGFRRRPLSVNGRDGECAPLARWNDLCTRSAAELRHRRPRKALA